MLTSINADSEHRTNRHGHLATLCKQTVNGHAPWPRLPHRRQFGLTTVKRSAGRTDYAALRLRRRLHRTMPIQPPSGVDFRPDLDSDRRGGLAFDLNSPLRLPGLTPAEASALLQTLRRGAGISRTAGALQGRHVALVAAHAQSPSALAFAHAAQALGAQVALVHPGDLNLQHGPGVANTLRMLVRLYVAIGCAGLDATSLALLRRSSALPVLHNLAAAHHPLRLLADVLTLQECAAPFGQRRWRLGVDGRPRSRLLRAWQALATTLPLEVLDLSAPRLDARRLGCDFLCLPQQPPLLLALDDRTPAGRSLQPQQWHHHQHVVQTALRRALDT